MSSGQRFLVAALLACLTSSSASAGGLFLPSRGVRASGRAGAFVAGADDPSALWYNPAGLGEYARTHGERRELLVDAAFIGHDVTYTRIDSGGKARDPVENEGQLLPIPTVGAGFTLAPRLALGVGIFAPYAALDGYPEKGPQRYSLITLHNSMIVIGEVALAYKVNDLITLGAGLQNLFFSFNSRIVFSGCPAELVCAPEDPEFDSLGEIRQLDLLNPSGVLGVQLRPLRGLRLGMALQLPFRSSSEGTVSVRLPVSGYFKGAHVEGERADIRMTFPLMLRLGVEFSPSRRFRAETGVDFEKWSQHDEIVIEPKDMRIEDVAVVGIYEIGPLRIPRKFEDTLAVRLGIEAEPLAGKPFVLRGGYVWETSAVPDEYLSVMLVDGQKHVLTAGMSYRFNRLRVDGVVGYVLVGKREVPRATSCAPMLNPIRTGETQEECTHDEDPANVHVGDGTYVSSYKLVGLGVALDF
ncbi:MAG: outer membrane protein transport protein [Deltaproteobacteria bacterium]|nr:outer membrane protein transport protein [Deltaproteobacteria bacterium]